MIMVAHQPFYCSTKDYNHEDGFDEGYNPVDCENNLAGSFI